MEKMGSQVFRGGRVSIRSDRATELQGGSVAIL